MADIFQFLQSNQIAYKQYDHEAVFTAEEAKTKAAHVPGRQTKNLFLCDDKKQRFYLVTICEDKRADLKHLRAFLGEKNLRFGPAEKLMEYFKIAPGAVSPLGLANDVNNHVKFFIDSDLLKEEKIYIHPNVNTATLEIGIEDFKKFVALTNHEMKIYETPSAQAA